MGRRFFIVVAAPTALGVGCVARVRLRGLSVKKTGEGSRRRRFFLRGRGPRRRRVAFLRRQQAVAVSFREVSHVWWCCCVSVSWLVGSGWVGSSGVGVGGRAAAGAGRGLGLVSWGWARAAFLGHHLAFGVAGLCRFWLGVGCRRGCRGCVVVRVVRGRGRSGRAVCRSGFGRVLAGGAVSAVAGFTGPRDLAGRWQALVRAVVGDLAHRGFSLVVGNAAGLDAFVREAAPQAQVFAPPAPVSFCPVSCYLSPIPGQGHVCTPPLVPAPITTYPAPRVTPAPVPGPVRVVTQGGRTPAALVARSVRMVQAVAAGGAGSCLVGFVSSPCPQAKRRGGGQPLSPSSSSSRCFSGYGSGTWASLAFAAGLGLPVIVFCCGIIPGEALPRWWPGQWVPAGVGFPWLQGWRFIPRRA